MREVSSLIVLISACTGRYVEVGTLAIEGMTTIYKSNETSLATDIDGDALQVEEMLSYSTLTSYSKAKATY